jgi:hypothetical protein
MQACAGASKPIRAHPSPSEHIQAHPSASKRIPANPRPSKLPAPRLRCHAARLRCSSIGQIGSAQVVLAADKHLCR